MTRTRSKSKGSRRLQFDTLEAKVVLSSYVVSPVGSDANSGTATAPFLTLQKAAYSVQPGDTVSVKAGTYQGFVVKSNHSGTAAAPITFAADPGVKITSPNTWNNADGIDLEGASYITIKGFNVTGAPRAGIRAALDHGVVIRNNTTDSNGRWGIYSSFSDNIDIENNIASRSVNEHGIYVANTTANPVVRNNIVWGNASCGIQMNGDASQGGAGIITGALIEGNTIYGNGKLGGAAINLDGVQDSRIDNNLIYNQLAAGITLFQGDAAAPSINDVVANNTISLASTAKWDISITTGSTGATVLNNILLNANTSRGSIRIDSNCLPGLKSDNNVVTQFSIDGSNKSLSAWRTSTGQDTHSFNSTASALFVNASANNYQLSSTSPAISKATNLSSIFTTDILGRSRMSTAAWDIGAYAYYYGSTYPVGRIGASH